MQHIKNFFKAVGGFFKEFGVALAKGSIFVKLSLIIMGIGYFRRKSFFKGILVTVFEAVIIAFTKIVAIPYISKYNTLGTVQYASVYNPNTMKNEINDFDNSFKILLFGLISILILIAALFIYIKNIINIYNLECDIKSGKHILTMKEEIMQYRDKKFYVTLLFLPCFGVILFTIIPLITMILVAFTDYDQAHMPPSSLFTWVGFQNFKLMFTNTITSTFSYSFFKVIVWTLIWAFFATFTCYFLGLFLAVFINDKRTKCQKLWRSLFVITIAVPQFVSLLLVRNFFADTGIVNTICANIGVTSFLKNIGLVKASLTYIPFLTDPTWAKVMIILINIWVGIPYLMLISTGVLMNIPTDYSEAARIDGANERQIFRNITLPYMLFVTGPYLITSFVGNINNFNVIYLLTNDVYNTMDQKLANSSAKEVDLLVTWLYRLTQDKYNYKMASVIGIFVFIICATFTLIAFNKMIKGDKEEDFQ